MPEGMTEEERFHYDEYCRLREEALAIYRQWDSKPIAEKVKSPHYKQASTLMREADEHKKAWVLGGT